MAIQAYDVTDQDGETVGAILVCTTSGCAIGVPVTTFSDAEDAEEFLQFAGDVRGLPVSEIEHLVGSYRDVGKLSGALRDLVFGGE